VKRIITLLLVIIANFCFAQNLVLNPSLEQYAECPNNYNQINYADFWSAGCEYNTSSEYFNMCALNNPNSIPLITYPLINIKPRTGNGFAGFLLYAKAIINNTILMSEVREDVSGKFKTKLTPNKCYNTSFYIRFYGYYSYCFSNSINYVNFASNKVSAYISEDSIIYPTAGYTNIYQLHPQINYHGSVLNDTTNWVKIEGNFIAQGNEQFIHIASFVPDDSINLYLLPNLISQIDSTFMCSYYLIDDVAVYPCDAPIYEADAGMETCVDIGNNVTIGTSRRDEYLYWWYDMQGNLLDTTAQITVSPTQTTTYYLVQKDFKFDETRDSVTVTVGNCPLPDYSNLDFEIYPNPCNGIVNVRFNAKIPEGTVMQLYDMIGQEVAKFPLTSATKIATVNLGNLATSVYHATVVVPDVLKKSVKLVVIY
jgi:hypothetical protein